MREENVRISRKIDEMFEEKTLIEKKLYKLQQAFEDRMNSDREIIEKLNEKIFIYENKLVEKKDSMNIMKGLINRQIINEMSQKFRYVYVVDPTKSNIDLNNELNYTRDILAKISKLINSEKIKNDTMENQIKNLQQELNLYRKNNKVYDCVTKEIKLDSIEFSNESNSSYHPEYSNDFDEEISQDSSNIKFPDKVQMSQKKECNTFAMSIPKLDFTKVNAQYQTNLKEELKDIKIGDEKKIDYNCKNKKFGNFDSNIYNKNKEIEADLMNFERINKILNRKYEKYKRLFKEIKSKLLKLTKTLKLALNNIEILKLQNKKLVASIPTTEDTVNKRNQNNTSMVRKYLIRTQTVVTEMILS